MQELSIRKSTDIEEELALIKAQLNFNSSKITESDLCLSRISEDQDNYRLSNLSSSLIDLKLTEINQKLFPSLVDCEKLVAFEKVLVEKDLVIKDLHGYQVLLEDKIKELADINRQYEVDLQYCIDQNKLAYEEIKRLSELIEEKNEIVEKMKGEGFIYAGAKIRKPNYKLYAEIENVNEENEKLKREIENLTDKNQELNLRINDADLRYDELMTDLLSIKKVGMNKGEEKRVDNMTSEFYRKLLIRIESENKELKSELEFIKVKNSELELIQKKETESGFVKDLKNELAVNTEKDLYKKVLCLVEIAKQNKEQRHLIQKIASLITKKTGKKEVSIKEMTIYITNNLR